ncbi:protein-tyrosine phosphatase [Tilletiaria anomala UBC 951]|uniref:Protein-tyrosine phosphatase n=1 Tax=Tilletiaria anomala (strain ATCC 24038 / CBS 436.72 / UBC 951) TaxID=1037660 RepID=A0A066WQZ1_TILAU|nr:protein-tyrosine phosphatase [Tilletiaria anomala UBC 951]KDN53409.1 protein-tyrosine phosphatase [Tilletiaria anomala UBC 951]
MSTLYHHHHHSHKHATHVPVAPVLEPPPLFAVVAKHIYRFSFIELDAASYPFLRSLQLKKVILLSAERPSKTLTTFVEQEGINLTHYGLTSERDDHENDSNGANTQQSGGEASLDPLDGFFGSASAISKSIISEHTIKNALQNLLDVRNHPIAICDTSGMHETGVLVGCMRKMQSWNFASILVEYRSFAGSKSRAPNERFIEMFNISTPDLPPERHRPSWLQHAKTDRANGR